ncbi:NADPH oxidase organizer 1-like isoform X2 [Rhinatrema bivittatum]|nr:NADPH oxidase organizer 1-like isoform X2 [Rhinatrema bivittatum]
MLSVLWSDHNNILIYRTFEEFKKLDRDLRRRFPLEAGFLRKSERIIPKLKDIPLVFRRKNKHSNRLLERLQLLETYSQELLCTDPKISQAQDVTQFFTPQTRDLDPSFPQDSIVIMPSEAGEGKRASLTPESHTPVTQPIVSQRYVCIGAYETKDTKNRPFRVKQDERLEVLIKDTTGWWLVENEEKQLAWFPAPYLQKQVTASETSTARTWASPGVFYFAAKGYEAQSSDEVSVAAGVVVEVLEKSENGWWLVWYNGKAGYVPSMYLQPYRNPHQKFQVIINKDVYGSTPDLQKSACCPDASTLPLRRASEGDPLRSSKAHRSSRNKRPLDRMRSRSLTNLSTMAGPEVRSLSAAGESNENVNRGRAASPLLRNLPEAKRTEPNPSPTGPACAAQRQLKPIPRLGQQRKDSGFDENCSMSDSDPALNASDLDSSSNTPKVPPRPKAHEILQTCSTVTKRAVQRPQQSQACFSLGANLG